DHYPGTKLSISEYNYGGAADISGAIAEADVLGIFGQQGLFAASSWLLAGDSSFLFAGFAMYRNYDGKGATFGDTAIAAANPTTDKTISYASISSKDKTNVIVIAINKETTAMDAAITIKHTAHVPSADVYVLTSDGAAPKKGTALTEVATNAFHY